MKDRYYAVNVKVPQTNDWDGVSGIYADSARQALMGVLANSRIRIAVPDSGHPPKHYKLDECVIMRIFEDNVGVLENCNRRYFSIYSSDVGETTYWEMRSPMRLVDDESELYETRSEIRELMYVASRWSPHDKSWERYAKGFGVDMMRFLDGHLVDTESITYMMGQEGYALYQVNYKYESSMDMFRVDVATDEND